MSNYRRLISYIYAYEGGIKGKNIGFAKIEARNGQCKIQVNVKKIYVGNNDMGVYLLSGDTEILLGKIFIRNGAGEFRTVVLTGNVEGSGKTMDQCFGLTIHSVEDTWLCYTTIWEDATAQTSMENQPASEELVTHAAELSQIENDVVEHAAEIELSEVTSRNRETEEMEGKMKTIIPEIKVGEEVLRKRSIVEEIEKEIQAQDRKIQEQQIAFDWDLETRGTGEKERKQEIREQSQEVSEQLQEVPEQPQVTNQPIPPAPIENQETLEQLEQEEEAENQSDRLWQHFRHTYPKIDAFDYASGCEILTIKPQDIGLLPRETWTYGNNSFLLHGYYNYRYLILVKLQNPEGTPRYLLGVPGHYYSNEKYMATMFGFPNFVLSKMQPASDGRFGYWYTDINMGNQ